MRILSDNFTSKSCKEVKDVDCKISYQLFNFFLLTKLVIGFNLFGLVTFFVLRCGRCELMYMV